MKSREGVVYMGSLKRKFLRNQKLNLRMSMKFRCSKCGYEKLIAKETIQSLDPNTFKDNIIFKCQNCNIRMEPITIEVDY